MAALAVPLDAERRDVATRVAIATEPTPNASTASEYVLTGETSRAPPVERCSTDSRLLNTAHEAVSDYSTSKA